MKHISRTTRFSAGSRASKKTWRIRTTTFLSFTILLTNSWIHIEISTKACTTRRAACFRRIDGTGKLNLFTEEGRAASWNASWRTLNEWGQVARASELTSIENQSEPSTKRGLYIYNDFMISLTRHHKAKLCTNHELLCFGSSQSVSGMRCTST